MCVPWKHVSLAACLVQLNLSLFMWPTESNETRESTGALLSGKAGSGAIRHVAAPEPTSNVG
jgi:hypothetical protein